MRSERVHGYLTRNGVRIAVRSATLWEALIGRDAEIQRLSESLALKHAECDRLKADLATLRGQRWVRIGTRLRIVRA